MSVTAHASPEAGELRKAEMSGVAKHLPAVTRKVADAWQKRKILVQACGTLYHS